MRLLLADDQPKIRFALRTLLRFQAGLTIVGEASTTDGLLALAEQTSPDVVLLGWGLRGSPTDALLPALRRICPHLYVIALSSRPEARDAALAAGADAFVSKIDPPRHLLEALADYERPKRNKKGVGPWPNAPS